MYGADFFIGKAIGRKTIAFFVFPDFTAKSLIFQSVRASFQPLPR